MYKVYTVIVDDFNSIWNSGKPHYIPTSHEMYYQLFEYTRNLSRTDPVPASVLLVLNPLFKLTKW